VIAGRELASFRHLFDVDSHPDDAFGRFLCVTRWLLSCFPREEMEKKPFNPTIGEQHIGWIEYHPIEAKSAEKRGDANAPEIVNNNNNSDSQQQPTASTTTTAQPECDWTEMIAEQVSHHPPLSAFFVRNKLHDCQLEGTLDFQVSFGGANHVNITSGGSAIVRTRLETYALSKLVPNLTIQRVIIGVKYYMWMGPLVLESVGTQNPDHQFKLELQFSEKNETTNRIKGTISLRGEVLYYLSGSVGRVIHYWKADAKGKKSGKKAREVLFDFAKYLRDDSNVKYPPPDWYAILIVVIIIVIMLLLFLFIF
jgi:hypothetical protein